MSGHNWYVLGPPWAGFTETFTILRDSPDPHVGEAILETIPIESMDEDDDHYRQRDLANWLELCDPSKVLELLAENEALRLIVDNMKPPRPEINLRIRLRAIEGVARNALKKAPRTKIRHELEFIAEMAGEIDG